MSIRTNPHASALGGTGVRPRCLRKRRRLQWPEGSCVRCHREASCWL